MKPLVGRNLLLTGASSGVGRHLGFRLAAEGATVVCCARRASELATLVGEIEAAGGRAIAQTCDVADSVSISDAFELAGKAVGPIDSVIVNAGINHAGPAHSLTVEHLDQILAVNLRGAFLTAQEGARRMIASGPPEPAKPRRVIFVASILGRTPDAGAAIYSATKAGVLMLTRALALEWARHQINVNAILPGYMPTEIVGGWFEGEKGRAQVESWPRRRLMPVAALDPAVLLLLSPEAAAISGAEIVVDDTQSLG